MLLAADNEIVREEVKSLRMEIELKLLLFFEMSTKLEANQ